MRNNEAREPPPPPPPPSSSPLSIRPDSPPTPPAHPAQLAGEQDLEGDLWMSVATSARKMRMYQIAQSALAQASRSKRGGRADLTKINLQLAKVKHGMGLTSDALKILEPTGAGLSISAASKVIEAFVSSSGQHDKGLKDAERQARLVESFEKSMNIQVTSFGKILLATTEWMVEENLTQGSEIKNRYMLLLKLTPEWEQSHFHFARFLDGLFEARVKAVMDSDVENTGGSDEARRARAIKKDKTCQLYCKDAVAYYFQAANFGDKHIDRGFPRLLSLWFEIESIPVDLHPRSSGGSVGKAQGSSRGSKAVAAYGKRSNSGSTASERSEVQPGGFVTDADRILHDSQKAINTQIIHPNMKTCPPHIFYTALPQLISRVCHPDPTTAKLIQMMMRLVLSAYPLQAM